MGLPNLYSTWAELGYDPPELEESHEPDQTVLKVYLKLVERARKLGKRKLGERAQKLGKRNSISHLKNLWFCALRHSV